MKIDLARIITTDANTSEDVKVAFVRQKADFVPLAFVPLGAVQLNVGYETLDGKPEVKGFKIGSKEYKGTPIRCKLTKAGNSKGATLMSGKFPLAYRVAQLAVPLDPDAFTAALQKAASAIEELSVNGEPLKAVFDPGDVAE